MAEQNPKNWRDLCRAALETKDANELMRIVEQLNKVLKKEEQIRREFRLASENSRSDDKEAPNMHETKLGDLRRME
jgi:hypothetical protein